MLVPPRRFSKIFISRFIFFFLTGCIYKIMSQNNVSKIVKNLINFVITLDKSDLSAKSNVPVPAQYMAVIYHSPLISVRYFSTTPVITIMQFLFCISGRNIKNENSHPHVQKTTEKKISFAHTDLFLWFQQRSAIKTLSKLTSRCTHMENNMMETTIPKPHSHTFPR